MADPDLEKMSRDELKSLAKDIDKALAIETTRRMAEARSAVEARAQEFGFTLEELATGGSKAKTKSGVAAQPPKYRHPENAEITWSGRGRQPAWYKEAIEKDGMSADDLLITPAT